jgi:DNA polymerase-3 subunit delta'
MVQAHKLLKNNNLCDFQGFHPTPEPTIFTPVTMPPLVGHEEVRQRLAEAWRNGKLPQVLLIEGPTGVGRQRLALWLGQLLLCEAPSAEPCGKCRACRRVLELSHPDLHWLVPIPRPKAGDADKQVDEAAEAVAQVLGERRQQPLYGPADGLASHGIASVRLLQRRASLTSVEGGPRVFVVGHAERLVPQESSPEAANALLKLLEEPPAGAFFLLTTTDAGRLLPTIRSRVVPVRLGRLTDEQVSGFLAAHLEPRPAAAELAERARGAEGSIGAAIAASDQGAKAYRAATELLEAALEGGAVMAERALKQGPFAARGEFTAMLDALDEALGEAARAESGAAPRRTVAKGLRRRSLPGILEAQRHVAEAREAAAGNVNPQLLTAVLGDQLGRCL